MHIFFDDNIERDRAHIVDVRDRVSGAALPFSETKNRCAPVHRQRNRGLLSAYTRTSIHAGICAKFIRIGPLWTTNILSDVSLSVRVPTIDEWNMLATVTLGTAQKARGLIGVGHTHGDMYLQG